MSKARKALDAIERERLAIVDKERALVVAYEAAKRKASELQEKLSAAYPTAEVDEHGTPVDPAMRELERDLQDAHRQAEWSTWQRRSDALAAEKDRLASQHHTFAMAHFDELAAELADEARKVTSDVRKALEAKAAAEGKWRVMGERWLALERACGLGHNPATRLDVPPFEQAMSGDAEAPIPRVVLEAEAIEDAA